jgi:hypothetical protein
MSVPKQIPYPSLENYQAEVEGARRVWQREMRKLWTRVSIAAQVIQTIDFAADRHGAEAADPGAADAWVY